MKSIQFFRVALWLPLIVLFMLFLFDVLDRNNDYSTNWTWEAWKQPLLLYGVWAGTFAYPIFALRITRRIHQKSEQEIIRTMLWSPFLFIPIYAVPWVVMGIFSSLISLASGQVAEAGAGLGMMIAWIAFIHYILILGYLMAMCLRVIVC